MSRLLEWLNRPYPLLQRNSGKWLVVLGFSVFTYLFLLLYQPYGAQQIPGKQIYLLGFAANVFLVLAFNYLLLPVLMRRSFQPENWQIKKEILYVCWSFLLIALLNYGYNSTMGRGLAPDFNLLQFVGITFSVGIFPLLAMVYLMERFLSSKYQKQAIAVKAQREMTAQMPKAEVRLLSITPDSQRTPDLELPLQDFLFATSEDNYSRIFYLENGRLQRQLLRVSLKKVEAQLADFEAIIRCHRSYLVNKAKIKELTGNARSLYLQLEGYEEPIPVSRSFPREALS